MSADKIIKAEQIDNGKVITFYTEEDYFSNVYPCEVQYMGHTFRSAEAAYQASRFDQSHPMFVEILEAIIETPDAITAKILAKKYQQEFPDTLRKDWKYVQRKVMCEVMWAKFSQNEELRNNLMRTGDKQLVEKAPEDAKWGAVENENNDLIGKNWAGRILMIVRHCLNNGHYPSTIET